MKKIFSLVCIAVLISIVILPSLAFKSNIEAEVSDLYIEIQKNAWSRAPAKIVYLPVTIGNLSSNRDILIKSIELLDKDKNLILEERVETSLKNVYEFAKSKEDVRKSLGINPPVNEDLDKAKEIIVEIDKEVDKTKKDILVEEAWELLKYKSNDKSPDTYTETEQKLSSLLYTKWIEIDLTRLKKDIQEEDCVPITARVNYEIGNTSYQAEEQTYLFYLNSLPTRTGWYPGDGHIHTQGLSFYPKRNDSPSDYTGNYENYGFSDANDSSTILARRNQANSKGLKWIIITDHAGDSVHQPFQARLEESEWAGYRLDCGNAQNTYPYITVCPGEELATVEGFSLPPNSGHLLCCANSSYTSSYGTCQDLINRANSAGGFGIIAHPYNPALLWGDWNASGFRGLEIISNQSNYSSSAVSKWDTLVTNNLQGIISGSYPKIIGMANSDVHNSTYMWGLNINYIYTGSSSPPGTNRSTVYNNLKAGRVSASSDGSLAVFSLNGYAPGSVVNVNPGTNNVSITVSGKCVLLNSNNIVIIIKTNNGSTVLNDSFYDPDTDFTKTYYFTASYDSYYRVEVTFKNSSGTPTSYCFVNPIFVNLPQ